MTVVDIPEPHSRNLSASRDGSVRSPMVALFVASSALYFAVGCLLVMRYNLFDPDAPSRVANAGYVLHSRDPHLSAVGFVWNPLPSLVEIPILQLSHWWPELRTHGLAGVLQSSVFMAAAVLMVYRIALDRGVGLGWRRVAVAAFALQPMILVYGESGMSEAAATFALLWCVRHVMRWADHRGPGELALAGLALGFGYLTRYEVASAAVGVAAFVVVLTVFGAQGVRTVNALANVAIVMFPIVVVAAVWALSGWVVNQQLFATLSSQYGNESIVESTIRRNGSTVADGSRAWVVAAARIFGMQPFAGIACAGAVIHGAITGRVTALVPVITFGPVLAFAAWGQLTSTTFGAFRYYLLAIPMVICVALAMWRLPADAPRSRSAGGAAARRFGGFLLSASVLIGFPVTVIASINERIGNQPLQFGFASLLFPDRGTPGQPHQHWYRRLMVTTGYWLTISTGCACRMARCSRTPPTPGESGPIRRIRNSSSSPATTTSRPPSTDPGNTPCSISWSATRRATPTPMP